MIALIDGTAVHVGAADVVVRASGVGYRVLATPDTLSRIRTGTEVELHTTMVVREDSMTLYGFLSTGERDTFEMLQRVQGVGPRLALALLAVHSPEQLASAVAGEDVKAFTKVPGVGPKVAARLLLELSGKLITTGGSAESEAPSLDARGEVEGALVSLGWPAKTAADAVAGVAPDPIGPDEVSATLKEALRSLGVNRG